MTSRIDQVEGQVRCLLQSLLSVPGSINNVAFSAKAKLRGQSLKPVRLPPTIDSHSFVHAYVDSGTNNATSASDLKVTGKCSVKVLPTPTSLVTDSLPPIASAIRLCYG